MARVPPTRRVAPARPSRRRNAVRRSIAALALALALASFVAVNRSRNRVKVDADARSTPREWDDMSLKCRRRLAPKLALPAMDWSSSAEGMRSRARTYARLSAETAAIGAIGLRATTTQGLSVDDVFASNADGSIVPKLIPLDVPVRAIVMPFPVGKASRAMGAAVKKQLHAHGLVPNVRAYVQDQDMYHCSIFHASHHLEAHAVDADEFKTEVRSVADVARNTCPIEAILERVFVTSGGVVVAGWNARKTKSSGEPGEFRAKLRAALPNAPVNQLVSDQYILHTTLARIVHPPANLTFASRLSSALTDELCGLEVTLDRAWFVQERHKLALALKGSVEKIDLPFECVRDINIETRG